MSIFAENESTFGLQIYLSMYLDVYICMYYVCRHTHVYFVLKLANNGYRVQVSVCAYVCMYMHVVMYSIPLYV